MTPEEIVIALGGPTRVAGLCRCKPPSVVEWYSRPSIPRDKLVLIAHEIERKTGFKRWDQLPDDWHLIWPELVGTEGAPTPSTAAEALAQV